MLVDENADVTRLRAVNSVVCIKLMCSDRFLEAFALGSVHRRLNGDASRLLLPTMPRSRFYLH